LAALKAISTPFVLAAGADVSVSGDDNERGFVVFMRLFLWVERAILQNPFSPVTVIDLRRKKYQGLKFSSLTRPASAQW
jgi:hypothetical protein